MSKQVICIARRIFICARFPFIEFARDEKMYNLAQQVRVYRRMTIFLGCGAEATR